MKITGEVTGAAETKAAFTTLASRVENDTVAASQAATIVANAAGGLAHSRTGLLAASYGVQEAFVINPLPYAAAIEYGVPFKGMGPQYVIRTAFDNAGEQVVDVYEQWIKQQATSVGIDTSGS